MRFLRFLLVVLLLAVLAGFVGGTYVALVAFGPSIETFVDLPAGVG